ncbi:MAG: acetyl-CoA carboxylase biotin carboxyl carrier protein [Betaproteobacteria bacterium]|nr:acetyl-CoA carboxylase biotin carboxyl carrier protein [Betaproteobacteria bacterium]
MEWTEQQILETLRLIEDSDFDEVKLETDNFKLHVRKTGAPAARAGIHAPPSASQARAPLENAAAKEGATVVQSGTGRADSEEAAIPEGMVAIRAPMIGTFYRAPAPHLPPFVEVGASVKPEDTVCLIEVMKLFNTIKAGVSGKVVKIVARNAASIKRDQVLMLIQPS